MSKTEEEEIELSEDDEFDMGDNPLISLLVSSEGIPLGESLANLVKQMETQNKILIKMLTLLKK